MMAPRTRSTECHVVQKDRRQDQRGSEVLRLSCSEAFIAAATVLRAVHAGIGLWGGSPLSRVRWLRGLRSSMMGVPPTAKLNLWPVYSVALPNTQHDSLLPALI